MSEQKKLYTREEFETLRLEEAEKMAADKELWQKALDVKVQAGHDYYWVHQTTWFGEPVLQLPQDLFALQEIIYKSKPDYIVEIGVAWGGSMLFYSTLMEALGGKGIIGVDIFIPDDLKERLGSYGRLSERIRTLQASSVEQSTFDTVKEWTEGSDKVMVILDSHHTHDHVLKELRLYSPLVRKGQYLVCGDTIIEYQPKAPRRPRPWSKGDNPKTALDEFFKENTRFQVDRSIENKLLLSNNPGGYLLCVED